jgi:hypothetical protein
MASVKMADASSLTELNAKLYERLAQLEERVEKQARQITTLTIELSRKYEPDGALRSYMNNMPFPAFIKIVERDAANNPIFINWHINPAYQTRYEIDRAAYKGATDFEMWPKEIATAYNSFDRYVLAIGKAQCDIVIKQRVCKWPTIVEGKQAIAGIILEDL